MRNSDMPAMPQTFYPDLGNSPPVTAAGLSKREHFAAMAMQGYCANVEVGAERDSSIVAYSLGIADALLAALEQKK